ncbi:CoA pyrophosphatase [Fulvivirgaceae bacterium BMA10]|uniref:CoA pyrophosphatase n=1 Tax=Splendidivirga corallicola TaxID=3051826 RepID=A0ABT8KQY4_9BACT|nr:CoA pyrophosphatase [Fulvivirgaceae bacterium BMA10]
MDFNKFKEDLEIALQGPLPGKTAQMKMMARSSNGNRFNMLEQNKGVKIGGVLLLLYPDNGKIHLPLMKRPDYDGVHGGQISFPGGKREEQDDDLIQTALREGWEEVGIDRNGVEVIGTLSELYIIASNFKVLPTIAMAREKPNFTADKFEVEEIIETSLDHLLKEETRREKDLLVRNKYQLRAPYFDVDGHVVWGATAMILSEFLEVVSGVFSKR